MKFLAVLLVCISIFAWSKNENKIDKNKISRSPNQIIPLDSQTEKILNIDQRFVLTLICRLYIFRQQQM